MKRSILVLCLTILTAAILVASTATTFATPDTGVPPYLDTSATTNASATTDAPATPILDAITLETTFDVVYGEQPSTIAPAPMPEIEVKVPEVESITEVPETETHVCEISRANERYHRFNCDECENYSRVDHDENTMTAIAKNEWFHTRECKDCGYEYAEQHNTRVAHNPDGHYDVCIECGYTAEVEDHVMENYFHSYYHDIECESCRYHSERHVGVKYTPFDANGCEATCKECGVTEYVPHEWDGFECEHCGYEAGLFTIAVIAGTDYYRNEDAYRLCELELLVNDVYVYVNVDANKFQSWNCDEGDLVLIFHQGNDIYDISQLVDGDVVDDPENFTQYAYEDLIPNVDELAFEDIVIDDIYYYDDEVFITFESGRVADVTTSYVVYDLRDATMYDIYEGNAVLTYCPFGTMTYFVVIW